MALSDEDRAAIRYLRNLTEGMPSLDREPLERVLKLAGEEPPEPEDLTFWFDPDDPDVWMRDDKATVMVYGPSDLDRWYRTGCDGNFSWIEVCRMSPKLVELVRADELGKDYQAILMELHWAWEAWHGNACGKGKSLSQCQYHECVHRWKVLLGYGFDKDWERG